MGPVTVRKILDVKVGEDNNITYTIQSPNYDQRANVFLEITRKSDGWYGKYVTNPELVEKKKNGKGILDYFVIEKDKCGRIEFQFLGPWLEKKLS